MARKTRTAALAAVAVCLFAAPSFARGGGGRGGGGGHFGGGGAHFGGGGGHFGGGHVSAPHYSAPHYSAPSYAAPHYAAPHYSAPYSTFRGPGHYAAPMHGYIGGGRGPVVAGGRVPAFYGGYRGGPYGRVWWGPHYGWRVPVYWGGYYRPYPAYWGVGFWVTDWIMLDYLAAEEARLRAYEGSTVVVPVESPPVDGGVREELRQQIAAILESPTPPAASATGPGNTLVVNDPRIASALAAPHHVFVVSAPVTVTNRTTGGTCNLTPADLVRTSAPVPSGQSAADATVAASKKGSCAPGTVVALSVADLVRFEEGLLDRVARGAAAANTAEQEQPEAPPPSPSTPPASPSTPAPTPAPQDMSSPAPPPPANGLSL